MTAAAPRASGAFPAEPPFPPSVIEELLRLFGRAVRAQQLYLPNNPIYRGAIDALRAAFPPIWAQVEELAFAVTETELRWSDAVVLEESSKSADSLPWLFYKDGVREVRLLAGFEGEEVVKLLEILQRARKASPDEDDLLTLLWEADFVHLRYRYVDLGLEPAAPLTDGMQATERPPHELREEVERSVESTPSVVNVADFDSTLYFLDEREIEYLRGEVRREYASDLRQNVVAILLDVFEQQSDPEVRAEVCELLENMLLHLLSAGRLSNVAYLLRESQTAVQRAPNVTAEQRDRLGQLPGRLSAPEALTQLLQSLDESADLPPEAEMVELFEQLRPTALATVFGWLPRLQNARLRPHLERAAGRLSGSNTAELVRLVQSPDREVSIEAIRRAGALKTPAAVGPLGKVMNDPDAELRQVAVLALSEIGTPGAMQALEPAIDDPDRDVRLATARALGARAYRPVLPRLEAVVKGKALRDSDLTEKMAMFEAYGTLCGEGGVSYLDGLLNGKGFFGRRDDAEIRACAAMALGRVGTESARAALRRAAEDKEAVVRNAVNRTLRGGAA